MLDFTEHPILKPPTDEEIVLLGEADPKLLEELHRAHEGRIRAATDDPIRYGFDLPGWERMSDSFRDYNEVLALGGNRSGKTTGCAKRIMEAVSSNFDGHIVCFSQNADTSIKVQQPAIWEMMPKEFRKKTKSIDGYINYSMQNGFTGSSFVFPILGHVWTSRLIHSSVITPRSLRVLSSGSRRVASRLGMNPILELGWTST